MKDGWKLVPFSEVCEISGGSQPPKDNFIYEPREGYVRLVQVRDYRTDKYITYIPIDKAKKFCKADDIMIGRYGPPIFGIFSGIEGAYNVALMKAIPNESKINKEYLRCFLKTPDIVKFVEKSSKRAAGQDGVRKERLYEYNTPIPPLSEQKQIVETLDKAFEKIDKAIANIERNIQNAEELYDSYLENIFSSENDLWSKESLGQVCHMIKRGVAPKYTEDKTKLLVINQKCIRDHLININLARRHDQKLKKVNPERILKIGDVLVNSTGTGTLGRIAQVKELLEENITVDTHITIVRPDLSRFYFEFFGYAMIYIENKIKLAGEGTSGQTELSRIKLSDNFFISFPDNIDLQKELTSKIYLVDDSTKNLIVAFKKKISELKDLKKSILEKAFKGELTSAA